MRTVVLAVVLGTVLGVSGMGTEARAEPPNTHEIIYTRPSGFWTSNQPAKNGAYRYRLLGIGAGLVLVTGFAMWRLLRRASAERAARS